MTLFKTDKAARIGKRIQAARRLSGMTQRDLGEQAGIKFTDVSKIESGFEIPQKTLEKILVYLRIES